MAKIIKIAPVPSSQIAINRIKTSRNSTTNPFRNADFEGNTLQYADVFGDNLEIKQINKLKMIASSVAGSMNKFKTSITEPIVHFVNNIKTGITSAWDYAKNTNISDLAAVKSLNNIMNTEISIPGAKAISDFIHKDHSIIDTKAVADSINGVIGSVNNSFIDLGKDIHATWSKLTSKIGNSKKISSSMSVSELENLWKEEINAGTSKMEAIA